MVSIQSVFNNISCADRLRSAWGSSFFITTGEEKILFDTGSDSEILLHNLSALNINPSGIKKIVISHKHRDHTGSLLRILKENKRNIGLYLPASFSPKRIEELKPFCSSLRVISKEKFKLNNGLYSSGTMGFFIKEQALVLDMRQGLVIVTGCAHSGILKICKHVAKNFNRKIYAAFGGFHLEYHPGFMIKNLYGILRRMGIKKIGTNHCSGERAFEILKRNFPDEFVDLSLGKEFILD